MPALKQEAIRGLTEYARKLDEFRESLSRAPSLEPARAAAEEASAILTDAAEQMVAPPKLKARA